MPPDRLAPALLSAWFRDVAAKVSALVRFHIALAGSAAAVALALFSAGAVVAGSTPRTTILVQTPGRAIGAFALSGRKLDWVSGPINAENVPTLLLERDLGSGRTRVLARSVDPTAGLVSTPRWMAYVGPPARTLYAVRHDGTHRHVLARNLLAAIAGRGNRVAWAEQDGNRQRIVSVNVATGGRRLIADLPRCVGNDCYRIDYVTLADDGVVFTRGAIGSQPSLVYRRADGHALERLRLPGDPQPDLAPSSEGALYNYYARGWYRWDFGRVRPHLTMLRGFATKEPLALEHGTWYLLARSGCRSVVERTDTTGRPRPELSAAEIGRLTHTPSIDCAALASFKVIGGREVSAWILQPGKEIDEHVDTGLVGVIASTPA